jgi:ligand-binding sensor domain-containing protein/signal transduction histidine kinase
MQGLICLLLTSSAYLPALGTAKPLREFGQQTWQSDSGLPQNTVRAITQTRDGYLWIGTEAGLVRFDGIDFAVYDTENTPALRSDVIGSLQEDAAGDLWIGTTNGLVSEHAGIFTAYGVKDGLPAPAVLALYRTQHAGRLLVLTPGGVAAFDQNRGRLVAIANTERLGLAEGASLVTEDAEGRVWIGGPGSLARVDPGAMRASMPIEISQAGEVRALAASPDGTIWAGGASGLVILRDGRLRPVPLASLPAHDVTSLLPDGADGMWIGTSRGPAWSSSLSQGATRILPEFAGMRVLGLYRDREGAVWVETTDGVARITAGHVEMATRAPALTGLLAIFEDREGSMWFGTDTAGLHVLRDQPFSTLTTEDGLSANLVRAVFEDHSGTMWIGTSGGGLDRLTDGKVSQYTGALPSKVILALAETRSGPEYDLWVGTPEGLARLHAGGNRVVTTADGLADDFVRSLYADADGSLWIGTRNGLSHYRDGSFHSYSKLDGLPGDLVGTMLRSRNGRLWVGTLGGLCFLNGDYFVPVAAHEGLPVGAVTALLEDQSGSLWVGINDHGLSRLRAGTATNFSAGNLPSTIYGMLEDRSGHLWLSSRKGVDRVSIAALEAYAAKGGSLAVAHYGSADGMRISEASGGGHPAAWRARDGGLWFATLDGAAVVYPSDGPRNPVPPLTAIEQVLIDEQPVAPTAQRGVIRVAPGRGRFSIRYAGLSFVSPQRTEYQYMLQGFDKNWVDARQRRTAFYTNVPPGSYRFLVRCANSDGVWSLEPAAQSFVVQPYFYQTAWFYSLLAIVSLGIGYLAYRWRVITVEAQYRAVIEERSRIAREIHDTLAQGYVAISVQLELAERLILSSSEAAMQQLQQTRVLVREGLAEARSSIWNLRAHSDAAELPSLLAAYAGALSRRNPAGAPIRFTVHGEYRPLARTVEREVERIAQQAMSNAVAHAQATSITATLRYDARTLEVRIVDNGVGMNTTQADPAKRGRFGLQGMRERAKRIGAMLEIDSSPGAGVTVILRMNLERAVRKEAR